MEGADVEPVPALLQEVVRDVLAVVLAAVVAVADLLGEVADVAADAGGGLWDFLIFLIIAHTCVKYLHLGREEEAEAQQS